jgi:hypothetical protein
MHHLTLGELALGGSAITAAASAVVAVAVSRASRRRDHVSRLWERRAEVYESVLCQVDWWRELREEMAGKVSRDEVSVVTPPPALSDDDDEGRRVRARLEIYGERKVREAYERSRQADRQYLAAHFAWFHSGNLNLKVHQGTVPAHQAIEGVELVRLRKAAESANDYARAEQEKLEAVVARAIGRLPRYERRAWRRLKAPSAD